MHLRHTSSIGSLRRTRRSILRVGSAASSLGWLALGRRKKSRRGRLGQPGGRRQRGWLNGGFVGPLLLSWLLGHFWALRRRGRGGPWWRFCLGVVYTSAQRNCLRVGESIRTFEVVNTFTIERSYSYLHPWTASSQELGDIANFRRCFRLLFDGRHLLPSLAISEPWSPGCALINTHHFTEKFEMLRKDCVVKGGECLCWQEIGRDTCSTATYNTKDPSNFQTYFKLPSRRPFASGRTHDDFSIL